MSAVGDLLRLSHEAHRRYREACPRRVPMGETTTAAAGDDAAAGAALNEACRARVEAAALDPGHADPAWRDERPIYDHDALLTFYRDQLCA